MKPAEIRALKPEEQRKKVLELKDELFKLRFQAAINQLDNPSRIHAVKKDIARLLTIEREAAGKQL
jgi:large subunit ribosomal protein L29